MNTNVPSVTFMPQSPNKNYATDWMAIIVTVATIFFLFFTMYLAWSRQKKRYQYKDRMLSLLKENSIYDASVSEEEIKQQMMLNPYYQQIMLELSKKNADPKLLEPMTNKLVKDIQARKRVAKSKTAERILKQINSDESEELSVDIAEAASGSRNKFLF